MAGLNDGLLIGEGALGVGTGKKVGVAFPDNELRRGSAQRAGVSGIVANKTTLQILEIDLVRNRSHQREQNGRVEGLGRRRH